MDITHNGQQRQNTILIIEDDAEVRNFIARALELEGYGVFSAAAAGSGMEIIRKNTIDLVLLDLCLPDVHGWTILREMKRTPEMAAIPVVVLTAIAENMLRKKTLKMGADCYLIKPLSAHSLTQSIADVLKGKNCRETGYQKSPVPLAAGVK